MSSEKFVVNRKAWLCLGLCLENPLICCRLKGEELGNSRRPALYNLSDISWFLEFFRRLPGLNSLIQFSNSRIARKFYSSTWGVIRQDLNTPRIPKPISQLCEMILMIVLIILGSIDLVHCQNSRLDEEMVSSTASRTMIGSIIQQQPSRSPPTSASLFSPRRNLSWLPCAYKMHMRCTYSTNPERLNGDIRCPRPR